jgi:hypothetical protein
MKDMPADKQKTLNEASGPTEELKVAYDLLLKYRPSQLGNVVTPTDVLLRMAKQEATIETVKGGDIGITPGMRSILRQAATAMLSEWSALRLSFDSALQPSREKINAVRDLESKKAAIEKKTNERVEDAIDKATENKAYVDSKLEKEKADQHFEKKYQGEGGRPVNTFGRSWLYFLILLGITSIEWLINYTAFFAWTAVPAIAAGFTIGMALAVALAAHVHGEYLKQRNSRFGPASDTKGRDIAFLTLATLGLIVAIVVAGWARYSLAMHNIGAGGPVIDVGGDVPNAINPMTDVYFSMGINMIVWLVGLVVAFMAHDENHELMGAELAQRWRTRQFIRRHKPLEKKIQLIKAQGTREIEQLRAATGLATVVIQQQRDMLEQVERHEDAIYRDLASYLQPAVDSYRICLGAGVDEAAHQIVVGGKALTGPEYKQLDINLDATLVRAMLS